MFSRLFIASHFTHHPLRTVLHYSWSTERKRNKKMWGARVSFFLKKRNGTGLSASIYQRKKNRCHEEDLFCLLSCLVWLAVDASMVGWIILLKNQGKHSVLRQQLAASSLLPPSCLPSGMYQVVMGSVLCFDLAVHFPSLQLSDDVSACENDVLSPVSVFQRNVGSLHLHYQCGQDKDADDAER